MRKADGNYLEGFEAVIMREVQSRSTTLRGIKTEFQRRFKQLKNAVYLCTPFIVLNGFKRSLAHLNHLIGLFECPYS